MGFNLLIVDDEEIAIRGIVKGIKWEELPYENIYTAMDADEAQDIMRAKKVHVVLSDIDMPNQNGLELLEWINEQFPHCVTLFLTGHADFKYAQQAVQLSSFNYLLKPIDHRQLQLALQEACEKAAEIASFDSIRATYNQFYQQWQLERPLLIERFWQDLIHYRQSLASAYLDSALKNYNLPLQSDSHIMLIQISIEQWKEEWSARDEEIMTYAIKNVAEEFFLKNTETKGHCIQDGHGILYLIIYEPQQLASRDIEQLGQSFIEHCREYLHCYLSCYIGKDIPLASIREGIRALLQIERQNVAESCTVQLEQSLSQRTESAIAAMVHFPDWLVMLETGKMTQLNYQIDVYFDKLLQAKVGYHELAAFYFGFMNAILQWLQSKGINSTDVMQEQSWDLKEGNLKSLVRLKSWTSMICQQISSYIDAEGKQVSSVVDKVRQYMLAHLDEEFSREKLAAQVYLNPAYLSRLFRRETGLSLTDYMVKLRMNKAKEQLESSNLKVSDIAYLVGYANFSHFSKLFKKTTGLTPQEYRKMYGKV
ncbi:helix-turn-helix domain-containing protein [Paenibacillus camelliae]|uniref:helix-turn-helix domain-containing protein n=1 Tax=Paenibacillus camelliae TaxID=512410 RepID=UPI00203D5D93|nr:helix-turn-helix domain-containing protein [Paenibacillus camelliae]MCM3632696.1 helix-turn-helix domain-containing protein [Paenibacillus camelliae]